MSKKFYIEVELDSNSINAEHSGEEIEDLVATALGGYGLVGHLITTLTHNQVSFPVIDAQPVSILENAFVKAREIYLEEREDDDEDHDDED